MKQNRINTILLADAYMFTFYRQMPKNVSYIHSYTEARGSNLPNVNYVRPFGIQGFIKEYLEGVVIEQWMIDEAKEILGEVFGTQEYFNERGFSEIIRQHNGRLPITIKAVEEGKKVGVKNVLLTVEAWDDFAWVGIWIETMLLRASWYGTSVCTLSSVVKDLERKYANLCGCDMDSFKFLDFGSRSVSSHESAGIGAAAHLVNYLGTDTVEGILWAKRNYGTTANGYSVYASCHATTTIYGKDHEIDAYRHFLNDAPMDKIVSIVTDSYSHENAVRNILGKELKDVILAGHAHTVIRPDSGDPIEVSFKTLQWLWESFGGETNARGFKVLNPKVRVLYSDGLTLSTIDVMLHNITSNGFSSENIIFGMGGKLLQGVDRDTFKFACKLSHAIVDGVPTDIFKDPEGDHSKRSKAGILKLIFENGQYQTVQAHERPELKDELEVVFKDGYLMKELTFEQIRQNAANT